MNLASSRRRTPLLSGARGRRLLPVLGAALLWLAPMAEGQDTAQAPRPPIRTLFGDLALILRPAGDGTIGIGVAGAARTLTLTVRATDARRWADSATKLLVPAPRRARRAKVPNDTVQRARVVLEEPGVGTASLVLSRIDSGGTRQFLLYADDAELVGIRQSLEADEVRTLVRLMRRAAGPAAKATSRRRRR